MVRPFPYRISGIASLIGKRPSTEEIAESLRVPDAKDSKRHLSADLLRRLFGYQSKSWDRTLFSDRERIAEIAASAMRSARLSPGDVDALLVVTCTPFEIHLDQDAFFMARFLGLGDSIPVLQLGAGCTGIVRALATIEGLGVRNALVLAYSLSSRMMTDEQGRIRAAYTPALEHPKGNRLWFSAVTFSDGAAAAVFSRSENRGALEYARELGTARAPSDPLVSFRGGGAIFPPGTPEGSRYAVYEVSNENVGAYYREAMLRNHASLMDFCPTYLESVRRLYLHQSDPRSVVEHYDRIGAPLRIRQSHADRYGNMASPGTLVMLHEDMQNGEVVNGDPVAFCVVGAGPERGWATLKVRLEG